MCIRDRLKALENIPTYKTYPAYANFLLLKIQKPGLTSRDVFDACIRQGLMIRDCSSFECLDGEYIRFCIMHPEDNTRLLNICLLYTSILLFVNGIELVILSLSKEKKEIGACILGVLEGLAGIILLFSGIQRFITDVMAAYMVGAIILIYGIFQIAAGTKVYKTSKGKGILSIVCGVLSVIVSIISFTHPILTMISPGYMIAFSVLMQGINMIVLGINFGKTEN